MNKKKMREASDSWKHEQFVTLQEQVTAQIWQLVNI